MARKNPRARARLKFQLERNFIQGISGEVDQCRSCKKEVIGFAIWWHYDRTAAVRMRRAYCRVHARQKSLEMQ